MTRYTYISLPILIPIMSFAIGFRKVTPKQLAELRKTTKITKPQLVFVNRREYFKPYKSTLEEYEKYYNIYVGNPNQLKFADQGSHYDARYRRKLMNNPKGISTVKSISKRSRNEVMYLVVENERPDVDIIINICESMQSRGVPGW